LSPEPGVFTLSLDTEIAWGTFDHGGLTRYARHFDQIRPVVRRLVSLLDAYNIPATWAFVGHLLLQRCQREKDGTIHPDVLRPRYDWFSADWHACDPATDIRRDPWWYGTDLLEMVVEAQSNHEIATHTFSHIVVDDPNCTPEIFRSQLQACADLHKKHGLPFQSIVYPRNKVALLDVLPPFGISAYRGPAKRWYSRLSPPLVKAFRLMDHSLPFPPPTYGLGEIRTESPTNVPASMFYMPRDGFRRAIPIWARVQKAKLGLGRAAARGELFHLWFHPFNLASDPHLFDGLAEILAFASELRSSDQLRILTMAQVAAAAQ
jgi:Polysaccharide deacetylase